MTSREFRERLCKRARHANLTVDDTLAAQLEAYFRLLARWNEKINLTALPLATATAETVDRLFVEPLAAARHVEDRRAVWYDLGSGGGSPAIPLKLARPSLDLTMVESKVRKAAFLREAIRTLHLHPARVENVRFEALAPASVAGDGKGEPRRQVADVVTVRAVRIDTPLLRIAAALLRPGGRLILFRPSDRPLHPDAFEPIETAVLTPDEPKSYVTVLRRCSTWNKAANKPVDAHPA